MARHCWANRAGSLQSIGKIIGTIVLQTYDCLTTEITEQHRAFVYVKLPTVNFNKKMVCDANYRNDDYVGGKVITEDRKVSKEDIVPRIQASLN